MSHPSLPDDLREQLLAIGLTAEELEASEDPDALIEMAWRFLLRGGRVELDLEGLAEAAAMEPETARRLLLAAGLTPNDGVAFTRDDVRMLEVASLARQIYGDDVMFGIMRLLGGALGTVADGLSAASGVTFEPLGGYERLRSYLAARAVIDGAEIVMGALLRQHIVAARERAVVSRRIAPSHDTRVLAVGFVDLVGFTSTSELVDLAELAVIVERFEAQAVRILTAFSGRLVKLIGDEAMFVVVDPADAVEATLRLVDAFAVELDGVAAHGGLAVGPVLTRSGDFYGPVVNLASRAADVAIPGEVLVTDAVQRSLSGVPAFACRAAGNRILKGFAEPVELWSVTRAVG